MSDIQSATLSPAASDQVAVSAQAPPTSRDIGSAEALLLARYREHPPAITNAAQQYR